MIRIEQMDRTENEVQAIVVTDCFGSLQPERCYTAVLDTVARWAGIDVDDRHRANYAVHEEDAFCSGDQPRYPDWLFAFKNQVVLSIKMGEHRPGIARGKRVWVCFWRLPWRQGEAK